jgi:hypothetical protein
MAQETFNESEDYIKIAHKQFKRMKLKSSNTPNVRYL